MEVPGNMVHVSVATAWEIAIKVGNGKLPEASEILANFENAVGDEGFVLLPISIPHVRAAGLLQSPHRDPFDRLLAAQAITEGLTLVTADAKLAGLGAPILW
jgi:PIN domain nuclease of toxin-antitoxin system